MYIYRIWKLKVGAPVNYVRNFMTNLCPSANSFVGQKYLETGAKQKKHQLCGYWYDILPCNAFSEKLCSLYASGKLICATEISSTMTKDGIPVAINIDKASDRTALMFRLLTEEGGNKGENAIVIGAMGDGANEAYGNLLVCFFDSDTPLTKQFLQNLIDNELYCTLFEVDKVRGGKEKCCAVVRRKYETNTPFPNALNIVDVDDVKYLTSSVDAPDLADGTDLVLLHHSGNFVALALQRNEEVIAWSSLGNASYTNASTYATEVDTTWKTAVGLVSVDGKMGSTLEGHQGQSCVAPCYKVARCAGARSRPSYDVPPRLVVACCGAKGL